MSVFIWLAVAILLPCVAVYLFEIRPWQPHRRSAPAEGSTAADKPPLPLASTLLATLIDKLEGDIGRYAFEIGEFADGLARGSPDDRESVLAATAAMLVANRRLQSDLAIAQQELQQQRRRFATLSVEARVDPLTGLANHRGFKEELARRFDQWKRHKVPVSLLLVEVDRFEQFSRYGELAGAAALKWMADLQREVLRQMDIPARLRGERFAAILPGTRLNEAISVAERLRATVAGRAFGTAECGLRLTVSLGVAATEPGNDPADLVKRAEEALQAAKRRGGNRAFMQDGDTEAIPFDKGLVRYTFNSVQLAAPYDGGGSVPPDGAFRPMHSNDISARGISLISDSAPDCKAFVVRLGSGTQTKYLVANIANVTTFPDAGRMRHRIGCAFVAQLGTSAGEEVDALSHASG
jgi:diguanylate cyclase (GGDEF)-like protein